MIDTLGIGASVEIVKRLLVTNQHGLHARASTKFVEIAQRYASDVFLARGDDTNTEVNGKSVLGIMTLGAEKGHEIIVRVVGKDAEKALNALEDLVRADFHGV